MRINELARELEVKAKAILDYLAEIGIDDKRSHSSAIEDEVAEKIKAAPGLADSGSPPAPMPLPMSSGSPRSGRK